MCNAKFALAKALPAVVKTARLIWKIFSERRIYEKFSLEKGTMLVALLTVIMVIPKKTYQSAVLKTLFIKKWAEGRRFENIKKMVKAKILNWDFLEKFGHFAQKFDSDF